MASISSCRFRSVRCLRSTMPEGGRLLCVVRKLEPSRQTPILQAPYRCSRGRRNRQGQSRICPLEPNAGPKCSQSHGRPDRPASPGRRQIGRPPLENIGFSPDRRIRLEKCRKTSAVRHGRFLVALGNKKPPWGTRSVIKRTIEVSSEPAHLTAKLEQLLVQRDGQTVASIPCEDIGVLVVDQPQTTYSHAALTRPDRLRRRAGRLRPRPPARRRAAAAGRSLAGRLAHGRTSRPSANRCASSFGGNSSGRRFAPKR